MRRRAFGRANVALLVAAVLIGANVYLAAGSETGSVRESMTCFDFPRTFEKRIDDAYKSADAVFSGEVASMTTETAFVKVIRIWKGKLAPEVKMPTGLRDMGNGIMQVESEHFEFRKDEKYLLFAYGKSADAVVTDACTQSGKLSESQRKISVLDQIVKRVTSTAR